MSANNDDYMDEKEVEEVLDFVAEIYATVLNDLMEGDEDEEINERYNNLEDFKDALNRIPGGSRRRISMETSYLKHDSWLNEVQYIVV